MSITVASIVTNADTYLGDATNDRITAAERLQYVTEATSWLLEELGNEHAIETYTLPYIDTVHYYKVTSGLANLLIGADLRAPEKDQKESMTRKSPRELAEEIGHSASENAWAIERRDGDIFLAINYHPYSKAQTLATFDTLTSDGGTWTADTTGSDATNVTADPNEYQVGSGSINFDIDVSQSANDTATIYNATGQEKNISSLENLGSFLFRVYIPDVTDITSITFRFSSDPAGTPSTITNYWSATTTTDINGNPLENGWNRIKIDWNTATMVGNPDPETIQYYSFSVNYDVGQGDATDFRLDDLIIAKPTNLTFHYVSFKVGTDSSGDDITAFTSLTDIPFFSGRYDQYKYCVAHKAASLAFYSSLRLPQEGAIEEKEALASLIRYRKQFESSAVREEKSFKIKGLNFRRRGINRIRRI
jgi:hypothetical protein